MKLYRAMLVRRDLGEIVPRMVRNKANATGRWFQHVIPMIPRRGFGYATAAAAIRAMDKAAESLDADQWRGLVWIAGRENEPALTVAI